jgi:Na+-translocating ferredoxin:NAD+ oxidoreductase subunit D
MNDKDKAFKIQDENKKEQIMYVSAAPHIHAKDSIDKIMWTVILALMPVVLFSVYHFGLLALRTIALSTASAVLFEAMVLYLRRRDTAKALDGSAFLTGLLLAMCLPPGVPVFMPIVGSFIAIVIAKHSMGGLGYNIFNPAHIGRAALLVSWPIAMTTWTGMKTGVNAVTTFTTMAASHAQGAVDAVTTATPLGILKNQGYEKLIETFGSQGAMYKALFLGNRNGSLGETSVVLLLLGGVYLVYKGYIDWLVPAVMIGTVGLLTWVFGPAGFLTGDPLFHMMAGGLFIGAFFMATDMVTTPMTRKGRAIFALGCAMITVLIRLVGGYPEGVCYSILLMNSITPLIDRYTSPAAFGRSGK